MQSLRPQDFRSISSIHHADVASVKGTFGIELSAVPSPLYDLIIVTIGHDEYLELDEDYFIGIARRDAILADIKGIYRNRISKIGIGHYKTTISVMYGTAKYQLPAAAKAVHPECNLVGIGPYAVVGNVICAGGNTEPLHDG